MHKIILGLPLTITQTISTPLEAARPAPNAHHPELIHQIMAARKYSSISSMAYFYTNMHAPTYKTKYAPEEFAHRLRRYGCHCFQNDDKAAGGVGPAVDGMDELCRDLYKCHRCIHIEFQEEMGDKLVNVDDGKYKWDIIVNKNGNEDISCKGNKNPDRRALCECDREFGKQIGEYWRNNDLDNNYNHTFWLSKLNKDKSITKFNKEEVCVAKSHKSTATAAVNTSIRQSNRGDPIEVDENGETVDPAVLDLQFQQEVGLLLANQRPIVPEKQCCSRYREQNDDGTWEDSWPKYIYETASHKCCHVGGYGTIMNIHDHSQC